MGLTTPDALLAQFIWRTIGPSSPEIPDGGRLQGTFELNCRAFRAFPNEPTFDLTISNSSSL